MGHSGARAPEPCCEAPAASGNRGMGEGAPSKRRGLEVPGPLDGRGDGLAPGAAGDRRGSMPPNGPPAPNGYLDLASSPHQGGQGPREYPVIASKICFSPCPPAAARATSGESRKTWAQGGKRYIHVDAMFEYFAFCEEFGPLNVIAIRKFGDLMLRTRKESPDVPVVLFSSDLREHRTNAVCLIASWLVLDLNFSVERAWAPFEAMEEPLLRFRDASHLPSTFHLTVEDVLRGLHKAKEHDILSITRLDIEMYEHADDPTIADLHEVVPGRFVAFKGPGSQRAIHMDRGIVKLVPSDYFQLFEHMKVSTVVRLNRAEYCREDFTDEGFEHVDMFFEDCSTPTLEVVMKWFELCRGTAGSIAVHCKAGLGRTGTLIAMWLMRKYRFSAKEVIGYLRVMRPGSVIGMQQQFLEANEQRLWAMDDPDLHGESKEALEGLEGLSVDMRSPRGGGRSSVSAEAVARRFSAVAQAAEAQRKELAERNTQAMLANTCLRVAAHRHDRPSGVPANLLHPYDRF